MPQGASGVVTPLRSGDIRDQVAKFSEIGPDFELLGSSFFGGERQISDPIL